MKIVLPKAVTKFIVRILIPLVAAAAVAYALLTPPSFAMGDGYVLYSIREKENLSTIQGPGGKTVLGPAVIRLNGKYPWVYGISTDPQHTFFLLNLKEHTIQGFTDENDEELQRIIRLNGLVGLPLVSWNDLFGSGPDRARQKEVRLILRDRLRPPAKKTFETN